MDGVNLAKELIRVGLGKVIIKTNTDMPIYYADTPYNTKTYPYSTLTIIKTNSDMPLYNADMPLQYADNYKN